MASHSFLQRTAVCFASMVLGACNLFTEKYPSLSQSGCTASDCKAGDYDSSLSSGGHARNYHLHVPTGYDPTRPAPLVLAFHGAAGNGINNEVLMRWHPLADEETFLVVEPDGLGPTSLAEGVWNAGSCCGYASDNDIDDVAFVGTLIDSLSAAVSVDSTRVFATGFSNGGAFAHRLACELGDKIAAIAPVSGLLLDVDLASGSTFFSCDPPRPVPIYEIHGAEDLIALYDGGQSSCLAGTPPMPSVADTISGWATRNACSGASPTVVTTDQTQCETFVGCAADTTLCTVENMGHAWPGATPVELPCLGPWSTALDATSAIWNFFQLHPM